MDKLLMKFSALV